MKHVVIVGGGASGIYAGIKLKQTLSDKVEVTILEKNDRIGKKVIASGNGKCNITNVTPLTKQIYNNKLAFDIYNNYLPTEFISDLNALGLLTTVDTAGRVYPYSESSNTVMSILLKAINDLGIKVLTSTKVYDIISKENYVLIKTTTGDFVADSVIISTGSAAFQKEGSALYNAHLNKLNLYMIPIKSGLVGLKVSTRKEINPLSSCSGVRQKGLVKLINSKNEVVFEEYGEIQFKDDGISGIVIMNASTVISRSTDKLKLVVDFFSKYKEEELVNMFKKTVSIHDATIGLLNKQLNLKIIDMLNNKNIESYFKLAKNFEIKYISTYELDKAQVAIGGVDIECVNSDLSLKTNKNIYITGELLDIDGLCGGYNLHLAFASGKIVSDAISKLYR